MAEPVIRVERVSKDFALPHLRQKTLKSRFIHMFRRGRVVEKQRALCDISFEVAEGEFFGVVGRNGSGKSTLLKILAGIYPPTSGHTSVSGRLVPFIELGVGFNPELTGRQNVYLNGALLGFAKGEVDEMYDDIVGFAELDGYMDQKLKFYSSGMQVRIAFSMATRARADILLIDEILAVGDEAFQRKCFEHFRALKKRGTTIVFVTHNMDAVREFCDRAILIEDSRIVAEGNPDEVATRYTRLFTPTAHTQPSGAEPQDEAANRWGEGHVRHTAVRVQDLVTDDDSTVTIELEAECERDVDDVVFGFLVASSSGQRLLGTNSRLKRQHCGSLQRGERVRVRWSIPNVLSDGLHFIDLAITDHSTMLVYEYWKDAASFTVVREEKTHYPLTVDADFAFQRVSEAAGLETACSVERLGS